MKEQVLHIKIDKETYKIFKSYIVENDLKISGFIRQLLKAELIRLNLI